MAFGDNDLRGFFRAMGVRVSFGGVSTYGDGQPVMGNFDRPMQTKLADEGLGGFATGMPSVSLPYNAFDPMPVPGDAIEVDGRSYTVSEPLAEDDASIVTYTLKAAA